MAFTKDSSKNDNSGLHDLQNMASSAKKRRSQRLSSQMDAQESILKASAALDDVALPDPNKRQEVSVAVPVASVGVGTDEAMENGADLTQGAAGNQAAADAMVFSEIELSGRKKDFNAGAFVLAAVVAGAGAFFLLSGKENTKREESNAAELNSVALNSPRVDDSSAGTSGKEENSGASDPAIIDPEGDRTEVSADETPRSKNEDLRATEVSKPDSENDHKDAAHVLGAKAVASKSRVKTRAAKTQEDKSKRVSAGAKLPKVEAKSERVSKVVKSEKKLPATASLDDVLSSVTGGVDKPIAKEVVAKPTKEQLGRGDFAKAMKKVTPAVKACYKVEEFSGMVKIKYSVSPDGSVSKARASGAHASSKTGECVVKAVRKAKFPAFSGAPMSSSFPFLLSP